MLRRLLIALLLARGLPAEPPDLSPANCAVDGWHLGESRERIVQRLGPPHSIAHRDRQELLTWGVATIAFVEGHATWISGRSLSARAHLVSWGDGLADLSWLGDSTVAAQHAFAPELGGINTLRIFRLGEVKVSVWLDQNGASPRSG